MRIDRRKLLALLGLGAAAPVAAQPAPAPVVAFRHGVASGDPLRDRVVIWTRASTDAPSAILQWEVAQDAAFRRVTRKGTVAADAARDHTAKVDVDDLRPGTNYFYRFRAEEVVSPVGRTRTLPRGKTEEVVLAAASCALMPNGYFNAYQAIADLPRVDAVIFLGDYIYELPGGPGGYGMGSPVATARAPDPPGECLSLTDYRRRLAQYRTDQQLQAAHARAAWIVSWDDHETADNSYSLGANNHQPAEGDWNTRKAAALKAFYEWMPIREPRPGEGLAEAAMRSFDFGDLACLMVMETRLTARGRQLTYARDLDGPDGKPDPANFRRKLSDPFRRMIGQAQEAWLGVELDRSVKAGHAWQLLAAQVLMAKVVPPDPAKDFTPEELGRLTEGGKRRIAGVAVPASLGLPYLLDSWDGYPAARERLYGLFRQASARPLVLAGDTHCFWANELHDGAGARIACELGTTSVTSPGNGDYVPGVDTGAVYARKNDEVVFSDQTAKGFLLLTLTRKAARADMIAVSTIHARAFTTRPVKSFQVLPEGTGVGALTPL